MENTACSKNFFFLLLLPVFISIESGRHLFLKGEVPLNEHIEVFLLQDQFDFNNGHLPVGHLEAETNHPSGILLISFRSANNRVLKNESGETIPYKLVLDDKILDVTRQLHRGQELDRPLSLSIDTGVVHPKPGIYRDQLIFTGHGGEGTVTTELLIQVH